MANPLTGGCEQRLPLDRDVTRLKVVHRQRVLRGGDADPMPVVTWAPEDKRFHPLLCHGWQQLLDTEHESIVVASWMTAAIARLGAPLDVVGAFGRIVEDEIRHVDICAQLMESFGGRPTIPVRAQPAALTAIQLGDRTEFETISALVGFFCVFEFLSGHIFREAIDRTGHEVAHWALSEIHRDEAFHGAFGFECAAHFVRRWPDAWKQTLAERVAVDIERFHQRLQQGYSGEAKLPAELDALVRFGLLPRDALLSTYYTSVAEGLMPRLHDLGIPIAAHAVTTTPPGSSPTT